MEEKGPVDIPADLFQVIVIEAFFSQECWFYRIIGVPVYAGFIFSGFIKRDISACGFFAAKIFFF
jgi:hypothetical protein